MRRDIAFFIPADVQSVYNAYLSALGNEKFRRECAQEPYHTLTFGLNFSAKFNFNGGSCTLHFIPWQGGTAVDMRFSLAQLAGARYEKYANELNADAMALIGCSAQQVNIPVETFLDDRNKVYANGAPAPAAPVSAPAAPAPTPMAAPAPAASARICANCGHVLGNDALFCVMCGTKYEAPVAPQKKFCPQCGNEAAPDAHFCIKCGTKLG